MTLPRDGSVYNLPQGVGVLGLKLLENTKASQTRRADVWIAFTTSSVLSVGKWWRRFLNHRAGQDQHTKIFYTEGNRV